jgi:hypothetical protein
MSDKLGPLAFRAGLMVGLRAEWGLPDWPHLMVHQSEPFFDQGKLAGAELAKKHQNPAHVSITGPNGLTVEVERAWAKVHGHE